MQIQIKRLRSNVLMSTDVHIKQQNMGKCDLTDFDCGMDFDSRQAALSISGTNVLSGF